MKSTGLVLAITVVHAFATSDATVRFTRLRNQAGVVRDLAATPKTSDNPALVTDGPETLVQVWSLGQAGSGECLIEQKLVGGHLPNAGISITTLDYQSPVPRTRVDQPFSVVIELAGLLTGAGMPESFTKVRLEQRVQSRENGKDPLPPGTVFTDEPYAEGLISANGTTVLKFCGSSLKSSDLTKANGNESFSLHTLTEGIAGQTQIASAILSVLPIASGAILGISPDQEFGKAIPEIKLQLDDLYPQSDTTLTLYEGTQINGVRGSVLKSLTLDLENTKSLSMVVGDLSERIVESGTYTLALASSTVYGKELLCDPVTFTVRRNPANHSSEIKLTAGNKP